MGVGPLCGGVSGPIPFPFLMVAGRPNCGPCPRCLIPPSSTRDSTGLDSARLDSRPFALRLGAHPLFSVWLPGRVSPLAVAALILTCRLSSFPDAARAKRNEEARQATKSPPRGSLPQLSLNQQGEAKGAHGPKDAGCVKTSYLGEEIRLRQRGQATPGIFQHAFSFFLFAIPATRATRSVGSAALPFFHSRLGGTVSLRQNVVAPTGCRSDRVSLRQ